MTLLSKIWANQVENLTWSLASLGDYLVKTTQKGVKKHHFNTL